MKLNIEKKLLLPNDVRRRINGRILELGIDFVDRDLGDINISWVKEFYCNFFRPTLDSVQVRGREILLTEAAIGGCYGCGQHQAEGDVIHSFDQGGQDLADDLRPLRPAYHPLF
ncbi:hypothetical protein AHAS_Ahas14G0135600 [Arachis hypogaea]